MSTGIGTPAVVLDTNIALDLLLFEDPSTAALRAALAAQALRWLVLPAMRDEFARVLDYPRVLRAREARRLTSPALLDAFDASTCACAPVPAATVRCTDPDDQPYLDLAVARRALLLSRDRAVLRTQRRLAALGVDVRQRFVTNVPTC